MRKSTVLTLLPYACIITLFIVAAFYDYQIDAFLYDPKNMFGLFFERLILLPITFVVPIAFYARYRVHHSYLAFLCYCVSCFYVCFDFAHFWLDILEHAFILTILSMVFFILLTMFFSRSTTSTWIPYERYLRYVLLVFLISMACMLVMKYTWGRVRYREMLSDVSQFTPWYSPQGYTGHVSFPSGHTTAISIVLCTLDVYRIKRTHPPFWWNYVIVFGLILCMMLARMIVGAHFLSDVTMGFCITYTVFLWIRRRMFQEGKL